MKTPEADETMISIPVGALTTGQSKKRKPKTTGPLQKETPRTLIKAYTETGKADLLTALSLYPPHSWLSSLSAVTPPSADPTLPGILIASRRSETPGSTGRLDNPTYQRDLQAISDLDKFLQEEQQGDAEEEEEEGEGEEEEEDEEAPEEEEPEETEEEEQEKSRRRSESAISEKRAVNERQKRRVLERLRRIQEELDDEDADDDEMKADYIFNVSQASVVPPSRRSMDTFRHDASFGLQDDGSFMDVSFRRSTPGKPTHQVKFAKGLESGQQLALLGQRQAGGQVEKKAAAAGRKRGKAREGLLALPSSVTSKLFGSYSTNKMSRDAMDTILEA